MAKRKPAYTGSAGFLLAKAGFLLARRKPAKAGQSRLLPGQNRAGFGRKKPALAERSRLWPEGSRLWPGKSRLLARRKPALAWKKPAYAGFQPAPYSENTEKPAYAGLRRLYGKSTEKPAYAGLRRLLRPGAGFLAKAGSFLAGKPASLAKRAGFGQKRSRLRRLRRLLLFPLGATEGAGGSRLTPAPEEAGFFLAKSRLLLARRGAGFGRKSRLTPARRSLSVTAAKGGLICLPAAAHSCCVRGRLWAAPVGHARFTLRGAQRKEPAYTKPALSVFSGTENGVESHLFRGHRGKEQNRVYGRNVFYTFPGNGGGRNGVFS